MWGISGKPLKRAIWNTPGLLAGLTTCLRFSSVSDGACVACCLFLLTGSCHVLIQIYTTGCCFPGRTTKAFVAQKGSLWVRVARHEPGSQAKKPRTARSQPPACSHKEHDILTTAEATAFAAQFWDQKMHPTKASQHEFWATCIDVDVEKDVKYNNYAKYTIKRGHRTKNFVPYRGMRREICKTQFLHYFKISRFVVQSVAALKNDNPSPPNPYISEMAFSCRFQKVYTYPPPPQVTTCLHAEAKVAETTEKCQNPQSWQVMNVPERYIYMAQGVTPPPPPPRTHRPRLGWGQGPPPPYFWVEKFKKRGIRVIGDGGGPL